MTNLAVSQSQGNMRLSTGPPSAHAAPAEDAARARLQREMKNPRVVLLDFPLECRKAGGQTSPEPAKEDTELENALCQEEVEIQKVCAEIIKVKPDLVITEMGFSDLAQHFLLKAGLSVIGHVDKTDNNRIARITGATICHHIEELAEPMVGAKCGAFSVKKIGAEYFSSFTVEDPKPWSIVLRGSSKDLCDSVMDSTQSAVNNNSNILKPRYLHGNSNQLAVAPQLQDKDQQACPKEAAATMQLREEQVRLREANVALKEMQLANRQELESVERARQVAAEELLQLQQQCQAEQAKLKAYKRQQALLVGKLKCCRAVVARTVGCIDHLYEQQGKETRPLPELFEESLLAEAEAVDVEAAQILESLEDDSDLHGEGEQ